METLTRLLAEHAFLKDLASDQVAFVTGCAKNVRFEAGAYVTREGDEANLMYLVREGRIALEISEPGRVRTVETLGEGDILGWSWLFPPYRWHLDARATTLVRAFAFDGTCLRKKMDEDPSLGYAITRRLLYQAHQRLERMRLQQINVYKKAARP